jgi:hypothetical protein
MSPTTPALSDWAGHLGTPRPDRPRSFLVVRLSDRVSCPESNAIVSAGPGDVEFSRGVLSDESSTGGNDLAGSSVIREAVGADLIRTNQAELTWG